MHPETLHRTDPWQGLKKSKIKSFLFSGATSDLQIPVTSSVTSPAPPPFATAMQCKWPPPAAHQQRSQIAVPPRGQIRGVQCCAAYRSAGGPARGREYGKQRLHYPGSWVAVPSSEQCSGSELGWELLQ